MIPEEAEPRHRACEHWMGGQPCQAGRLICEQLPVEAHPKWAADVLRLVLHRTGIRHKLTDLVLDTADRPGTTKHLPKRRGVPSAASWWRATFRTSKGGSVAPV